MSKRAFSLDVEDLDRAIRSAALTSLEAEYETNRVVQMITEKLKGVSAVPFADGDDEAYEAMACSLARLFIDDEMENLSDEVEQMEAQAEGVPGPN